MAQEKISYAQMADGDIQQDVARMEAEYVQLKFDHAVRGLANPMEIRMLRREIARAKTEIRARQVAAFTPEQLAQRSKIRARRAKR